MLDFNIRTIVHILVEAAFVAGVMAILFRLRQRISLGPLYVFVGTNQFLSVVLASTVYVALAPSIYVSPGSTVLFPSSLFAILLVYLRTDIPTTRGLIFGVIVANAALTVLLWFTSYQLNAVNTQNLLNVPIELFSVSPVVFLSGTGLLLVDTLLVIVIHDFLALHLRWMAKLWRIMATLLIVLYIDAIVFSIILALGGADFSAALSGQLVGKTIAGIAFSLFLTGYLRYFDSGPGATRNLAIHDVFSILTYRDRYRLVSEQLKIAQAANRAKSRFLTNMSHELRTPLNAIIGFTSILHERSTESEDQNFLKRVLENGRHLLDLINGLLDLSKIESGHNELEISSVDLNVLVRETIGQLQSQAATEVDLRVELPLMPALLETDRRRMKQILINLIGNSLKFTSQGHVVARLAADATSGKAIRIDILDTGIGIPRDNLAAIFEPFFDEQARSRTDSGTGLGLAISRALCEQMGHTLQVASDTGKGSQFSIVFATT